MTTPSETYCTAHRVVGYGLDGIADEGKWTTDPDVLEADLDRMAGEGLDWIYIETRQRVAFDGDTGGAMADARSFIAGLRGA